MGKVFLMSDCQRTSSTIYEIANSFHQLWSRVQIRANYISAMWKVRTQKTDLAVKLE